MTKSEIQLFDDHIISILGYSLVFNCTNSRTVLESYIIQDYVWKYLNNARIIIFVFSIPKRKYDKKINPVTNEIFAPHYHRRAL